jgi:plasmid stability protein
MALPLRRLLLSQEPPVEVRTGRAARHTEAEARGIITVALDELPELPGRLPDHDGPAVGG